jgi:hypothetical protein
MVEFEIDQGTRTIFSSYSTDFQRDRQCFLESVVHKSGDNLWISFRNFYVSIEKLDSLRLTEGRFEPSMVS